MEIIIATLKGLGAGLAAATIGYLKTQEKFDPDKFAKTILIGTMTGAIGGALNMQPTEAEQYLAYPLVVYGIDAVAKLFSRKVITPAWNKLKTLFQS